MEVIKMQNITLNKTAVIHTGDAPKTYNVVLSSPGEHWGRSGMTLELALQRAVEHVSDTRLNGLKFRPDYIVV